MLIGGAAALWPAGALAAIANSPSTDGVQPTIVAGNPTSCGISGATGIAEAGPGGGLVSMNGATINVVSDGTTFSYTVVALPTGETILGVFAKGGDQGGNLYNYTTGPPATAGGIPVGGTDGNLHPPPTGSNQNQFGGISHILFCFGTPATAPNTPPPNKPPTTTTTTTTPTSGTTSPTTGVKTTTPTKHKKHKKHKKRKKHVKAKTISRPPRVSSGFTG